MNDQLKQHLRHIDIAELQDKISVFRALPIRRMSRKEIAAGILKVLSFDTPHGKIAMLASNTGTYPAGTRFYRVRTLKPDDTQLPLKEMGVEADVWSPPASVVKIGRLNQKEEPMLYTSPMLPKVAVEEMKIPGGVNFSLIVYEAMEAINVTSIGLHTDSRDLNKDENLKMRMLTDFLAHEFTRDVGAGTEHLYNISDVIAKDYFDLPPAVQDAWCYPSVAERPAANVCFRPAVARKKLRLVGVQIATCSRTDDHISFRVKCIASGFNDDGFFLYHAIGSEIQQSLFPEIKLASS